MPRKEAFFWTIIISMYALFIFMIIARTALSNEQFGMSIVAFALFFIVVIIAWVYSYFSAFRKCASIPRMNVSIMLPEGRLIYNAIGLNSWKRVHEIDDYAYLVKLEEEIDIENKIVRNLLIQSEEPWDDLQDMHPASFYYKGYEMTCPAVTDHQLLLRGFIHDDTAVVKVLSDKKMLERLGINEGLGLVKAKFLRVEQDEIIEMLVSNVVRIANAEHVDKITKNMVLFVAKMDEEISRRPDLTDIINRAYDILVKKLEMPVSKPGPQDMPSQNLLKYYETPSPTVMARFNSRTMQEKPQENHPVACKKCGFAFPDKLAPVFCPMCGGKQEDANAIDKTDPNFTIEEAVVLVDGLFKNWDKDSKIRRNDSKI